MARIHLNALLALALLLGGAANAAPVTPGTATQPAANASAATPGVALPQFRINPVDQAWHDNLPRDATAATRAYLDRLPPEVLARSNAYFEGGYWLQLWNFLIGLLTAGVLLQGRRSARMRDWAQRIGRKRFFADALYGAGYTVASFVISVPLTLYQGYFREHQYAMATQNFVAWGLEQLVGLGVSVVTVALVVAILYAVMRRTGERWWLWGTLTLTLLMTLMLAVAPVLISPLFNTYTPMADGPVKSSVLAMAKSNGVPVDNVYVFDASRQTTQVSANVAGLLGTAAVRLNDNLLRRCTPAEIRAVMGHELGHYVLNHIPKTVMEFGILILAGFLFAQWMMGIFLTRWGHAWGLTGVTDVASLPLLFAVFAVYLFLATPILNTMVRTQEMEADHFGLNLAREPQGAAEVNLKLTEYRKPDPGPVEEFIFFDHPSARTRIHEAMRWREAMGTP
jgi:STE24 endopeptidase